MGRFILIGADRRKGASAAVWAWGCQGQLGGQQVIFNRYSMYVVEGKKPFGSVKDNLIAAKKFDAMLKGDKTEYSPNATAASTRSHRYSSESAKNS